VLLGRERQPVTLTAPIANAVCTLLPCFLRLAGPSRTDRGRRQSRRRRPGPAAPARLVGQPHETDLQKPLYPLIDKAPADPDRGGNRGDRDAIRPQ
jgi:hypothetical protein